MTRFSTTLKTISKVENLAGGEAYRESDKLRLASIALTSFMQDKFYKSYTTEIGEIHNLIKKIDDLEFTTRVGFLSRSWGMRSVTHVIAAEIANTFKNNEATKYAIANIIWRPDDAVEIMAYWLKNYGKPIPNSLKKGISIGLSKFSDYQISKYKCETRKPSLVDVINLVHMKPTKPIDLLMKGKLTPPETWEVLISMAGSDKEQAKKVWETLIQENKLGYFALLRNLRTLEEVLSPEAYRKALSFLKNPTAIGSSLVLPFRYLTASKQVQRPQTINAISQAMDISLSNIPKLRGHTVVAVDQSGSMHGRLSEIANIFAASLGKTLYADIIAFSEEARTVVYNPNDSILTIAKSLGFNGGGTNFHSIFEEATKNYKKNGLKVDRIIILSDIQAWIGHWTPKRSYNRFSSEQGFNPEVWSVDLAGYGTLQFPEQGIFCLAGFSEKIFDLMNIIEKNPTSLIDYISNIVLPSLGEKRTLSTYV